MNILIYGKPNCKCLRGEKHVSLFLTRSKDSKIEQLYIPKEKEQMVRDWAKNFPFPFISCQGLALCVLMS